MPKKEMNVARCFFNMKEIWTKCKNCGRWNKIREGAEIDKFRPTPKKPITVICQNGECGKEIVVERLWFSRKGMKTPTRDAKN